MIGYSDSNKESGFVQSAWALYRAQAAAADISRRTGVAVQIFHGRGGAVGRGGGPANRAILAQPRGTVNGRLRLTEQGEMIADRYGHHAIAERHLGQVVNAVLRSSFGIDEDRPLPEWEHILDRLAERACLHYRSLVYETPEFLTYFEQATPIGGGVAAEDRLAAAAPRRRQGHRRIAGHPLGVQLDAEPAHAAGLVRPRQRRDRLPGRTPRRSWIHSGACTSAGLSGAPSSTTPR